MAYLEQSTRYIAYNQRLENGQYRYYRPPEILDSPHGARFVGEMDRVFDTYGALLPQMQAWVAERFPQQAGDSDFVYRQATPGQVARRAARPAAGGQPLQHRHLRHRPVLRATAAAHARPPAPRGPALRRHDAVRAAQGHPVVPPARRRGRARAASGRRTSRRPATGTARVVARLWPDLVPGAPGSVDADQGEVERSPCSTSTPTGRRRSWSPPVSRTSAAPSAEAARASAPARPRRPGRAACRPTSATAATAATVPAAPSSAPTTASSSSPTTARSATCSVTAC